MASIVVNGGLAQRSQLYSLSLEFDAEVTIAEDAFQLSKRGNQGGVVDLQWQATLNAQGRTRVDFQWTGSFVLGGALVDGNYQLDIDGSKVIHSIRGALDGDRNGIAGGVYDSGRVQQIASIDTLGTPTAIGRPALPSSTNCEPALVVR